MSYWDLTFFAWDIWFTPVFGLVGTCAIVLATSVESLRDFIEEKEY